MTNHYYILPLQVPVSTINSNCRRLTVNHYRYQVIQLTYLMTNHYYRYQVTQSTYLITYYYYRHTATTGTR